MYPFIRIKKKLPFLFSYMKERKKFYDIHNNEETHSILSNNASPLRDAKYYKIMTSKIYKDKEFI